MAKGILGNDPFQRGAALRTPPPQNSAVEQPRARTTARTKGWKGRSSPEVIPPKSEVSSPPDGMTAPPVCPPPENVAARSTPAGEAPAHLLRGTYRALSTALGLIEAPVDAYGEDAQLVRDLSPLADFFYDRYWRVSVQGATQLPAGSGLLAANHAGALPLHGPMLRLAIARHRPDLLSARWLAEESLLQVPFLGVLLRRIGAVRATPENALRLLEDGRPLIVFPEGTQGASKSFMRRYELKPFGRGGFVKIAARTRAPIVPVAIVGAGEAMPVLANLPIRPFGLPHFPLTLPPLPTKWVVRFGEPMDTAQVDPDDASDVARWTEQVRASVQRMLNDILGQRRSIFAG